MTARKKGQEQMFEIRLLIVNALLVLATIPFFLVSKAKRERD